MSVGWVDVVLDRPRPEVEAAASFWSQVAGCTVSPWREGRTFTTLCPPGGDDYLRVQAVDEPAPRGGAHLDLRVADPALEAVRLRGLGATVVSEAPDLVVLRSPAGLALCLTPRGALPAKGRPPAVGDPSVRLDQVTLDLPASVVEVETGFWVGATGWELLPASSGEFRVLTSPGWGRPARTDEARQAGPPVRLLLQRLLEPEGPAGAHVDLACADRAGTTAQHVGLGAEVAGQGRRWTVMRDPTGGAYCLTDRDPRSGTLPA